MAKWQNGKPKTAISLGTSLKNWELDVFGVGHCVGKAAVSCERGAENGHNNKTTGLARPFFVEAKRPSCSYRRGQMRPPRLGGINNN